MNSALKLFLGNDSNTPALDLDRSRPTAVAPDLKALILANLPKEGRIETVREPLQRKLDSLAAVLRVHQRDAVYEVRVFDTQPRTFAFVGLHERAVLLISDAALIQLSASELQASAAHEIGHEYVWAKYHEAAKRQDNRMLKELELFCDGVAVLTLRRIGVDPSHLLSAAEKVKSFNRLTSGPAESAERYPTGVERKRFALAVMNWADSHPGPAAAEK